VRSRFVALPPDGRSPLPPNSRLLPQTRSVQEALYPHARFPIVRARGRGSRSSLATRSLNFGMDKSA
jgi:hypothetical protein